MNLQTAVMALPPSDVRDGPMDKATGALEKLCQALDRYLIGDNPPAANLVGATIHKMEAFLHLVDAQEGKVLTASQAASLRANANQIIADLQAILAVMQRFPTRAGRFTSASGRGASGPRRAGGGLSGGRPSSC
jgi:hypothetical protein